MITHSGKLRGILLAAVVALVAAPAAAQNTQPVWWPPHSLYGRPVAQPYFEFPTWARYSYCRPAPLAWGYDPFPNYGPDDCGGMGVPTINCPRNFVAHRPNLWYASADYAPLTLDFRKEVEFAELRPGNAVSTPALGTSSLNNEFDSGAKVTIGRRIFGCYRIEGTYWGSYEWDDSVATRSAAGQLESFLSGNFGNTLVPALDNNTFISVSNQTRMNNAEVNGLYWIDMPPGGLDVSLLAGFRYLRLDDRFAYDSTSALAANSLDIHALNQMYCAQIGLSTDWLLHSRFWVNFSIKGAIALNDIALTQNSSQTVAVTPPAQPTTTMANFARDQERTAWLGDLSLAGNFQMTPWLVARLGYQAIFIDGAAIAAQNANRNNALLTGGPLQVKDNGGLQMHGPFIGLMGVW